MIKNFTLLSILVLSLTCVQAQKKSDLLLEIENLKTKIFETENELAISRKKEVVSKTEAESYKAQADELLETNASLMQNINSFTKASIEKSENIGKTLESLREKEAQLKMISDRFSSHDSIALLVLTNLKKSLGENSNINVASGAVIVSLNEATRTGLVSKDATEKATADTFLQKIAAVVNANKDANVVVEGLSNTGELDVALNQATAIANTLLKIYGVDSTRMMATAKDGGFTEGINIKILPRFDAFYFALREQVKAANK
tara:strand:+ start:35584 stop:36366 length:783 start_codon:yes stop_codon:yes gene_type:complete